MIKILLILVIAILGLWFLVKPKEKAEQKRMTPLTRLRQPIAESSRVVAETNQQTLNSAIHSYWQEKGFYPQSLDELTQEGYLARIHDVPGYDLIYDSAAGKVVYSQKGEKKE